MEQTKTDPRILRTRKLIMESFIELSEKKEFKDITIKDITTEAMVNRATFYYHFLDKYDLLEKALSEVLLIRLNGDIFEKDNPVEESLVTVFLAITSFQKSLSTRCHRGYEDTIARIIREQLEVIFYKMLLKRHSKKDDHSLKIAAGMLSWGIYGASVQWRNNPDLPPEEFIKSAIPYLLMGIDYKG